jgi:hypothetical protein
MKSLQTAKKLLNTIVKLREITMITNKKEYRKTSTNGRWGLVVLCDTEYPLVRPIEGKLIDYGTVDGHRTFEIIPEEGTGRWYYWAEDAECISGCAIVHQEDLQSSQFATLIVGSDTFIMRSYGYKRRSSDITVWKKGQFVRVSSATLAAMGLLPGNEGKAVEIEPPKNTVDVSLLK